jgi:DNA uptake protein ComE-like DNA-binding protein
MKRLLLTTISLLALCGCTPNSKTPDQIRQDAAAATASASKDAAIAAQDAKAAVQGIQDGIHAARPLNINTASESDLESLPGIDPVTAGKIMAHRPYASPSEMVDHHAISRAEYDRIANKVVAQ